MSQDGEVEAAALRERVATLERCVDALETTLETATNRDIPLLKGTVRSIVDADIETIEALPAVGRAFGRQCADRDQRLGEVEARVDGTTHAY